MMVVSRFTVPGAYSRQDHWIENIEAGTWVLGDTLNMTSDLA